MLGMNGIVQSSFQERIPLSLFPLDAVELACISLPPEIQADISGHTQVEATVDFMVSGMSQEEANALFHRALIATAVSLNETREEQEIQGLLADSAHSITTQNSAQINQLIEKSMYTEEQSPHTTPEWQDEQNASEAFVSKGYVIQQHSNKPEARLFMDPRQFPLPILLHARKSLRDRIKIAISPAPGEPYTVVWLFPRAGVSLEQAIDSFVTLVTPWRLAVPDRARLGSLDLDGPLPKQPPLPAGHPALPGSGLPITYFRTFYGEWEGASVPYRLNELFPLKIAPDLFFVSTRHRTWAILTAAEYRQLIAMRAQEDPDVFELYEALGFVLTKRQTASVLKLHASRYSFMHRPPSLFIMIPTNRCNLSCKYCHAEAGSAINTSLDMDLETAYRTVDFFFSVPVQPNTKEFHLEFQGGEAILRWDMIKAVMDYAEQKGAEAGRTVHFNIATNLTTMTDEIAQEVKERKIGLSSSLDAPKVVHDEQRRFQGGQGSYDKAIQWSNKLAETYGVRNGFLPTLTKNHLGHAVDLVDTYRHQRQQSVYMRPVHSVGRACDLQGEEDLGLDPDDFVDFWKQGLDRVVQAGLHGEPIHERKAASFLGNMLSRRWSYMCLRRPCGTGLHQVVVDQKGDIFTCDQARSNPMLSLGNVHTNTFDECYTSDTAKALRTLASEVYPLCNTCALSAYCGYCVARGTQQHHSPRPIIPVDYECRANRQMIPHLIHLLTNPYNAALLASWVPANY